MNLQPTLFDAAQNRNDVYHAIEPELGEKRAQVLLALRELGEATDEKISEKLNWTINRVTGRRFELVELDLIEQARTEKGPYGYPRTVWRVNELQLTYFITQHGPKG